MEVDEAHAVVAEEEEEVAETAGLRLVVLDSVATFAKPVLGRHSTSTGATGGGLGDAGGSASNAKSMNNPLAHALLMTLGRLLLRAATEHGQRAVLVTNHEVRHRCEGSGDAHHGMSGGKPALGKSWAALPSVRLELTMPFAGSAERRALLTKSPRRAIANACCAIVIGDAGLAQD